MLLAASFVGFFFAPGGLRPRWAAKTPSWRDLTAMDQYYQNGPLPTWIGWYAQQLPHGFHAFTALLTLAVELALVWMVFLPRRFRITCFLVVTALQIGIILTANYAFLNYLVLSLGFLLLDDRFLVKFLPAGWGSAVRENLQAMPQPEPQEPLVELDPHSLSPADLPLEEIAAAPEEESSAVPEWKLALRDVSYAA